MEETPAYVVGRTIGRLGRTNPVGLAILGIGSVVAANELIHENPLPEGDTGLRGTRPKRLFDGSDMATYPNTKRIKHHARQPKQRSGEGFNQVKYRDTLRVGNLLATRLKLPDTEDTVMTDHPRNLRERDIYLKGYKIDAQWFGKPSNTVDVTNQNPSPIGFMGMCVVNMALLQFHCPVKDTETEVATALLGEWWASHEGTQNKSRAFTGLQGNEATYTDARNKWQDYWLSGRINPHHSKGFRVLARERCMLQQILQNGTGGPGQKNQGRIAKYFRIPQHIYLHNNDEANWEHPIYMVTWISPLNYNYLRNYPTSGVADQFEEYTRITCYYKDIEK